MSLLQRIGAFFASKKSTKPIVPDTFKTYHISEADYTDGTAVVAGCVYFMQINADGDRRVLGYGRDWATHSHFLTCLVPWADKVMEYGDGSFYCDLAPVNSPNFGDMKTHQVESVPKFKTEGNVIFLPQKNT